MAKLTPARTYIADCSSSLIVIKTKQRQPLTLQGWGMLSASKVLFLCLLSGHVGETASFSCLQSIKRKVDNVHLVQDRFIKREYTAAFKEEFMLRSALFLAAILTGFAAFPMSASADLQGTCVNVHREGPFLVATCRNAYGGFSTSRIELGSCPPGSVGNNNGQLTCYAGGGGYGGYGGGYGGGSYGGGYGYGRPRYGY